MNEEKECVTIELPEVPDEDYQCFFDGVIVSAPDDRGSITRDRDTDYDNAFNLLLIEAIRKRVTGNTKRKGNMYSEIQQELKENGYEMSREKVRQKWHRLLRQYRRIKEKISIGNKRPRWEYFELLDSFMSKTLMEGQMPVGLTLSSQLPGVKSSSSLSHSSAVMELGLKSSLSHSSAVMDPALKSSSLSHSSAVMELGLKSSLSHSSAVMDPALKSSSSLSHSSAVIDPAAPVQTTFVTMYSSPETAVSETVTTILTEPPALGAVSTVSFTPTVTTFCNGGQVSGYGFTETVDEDSILSASGNEVLSSLKHTPQKIEKVKLSDIHEEYQNEARQRLSMLADFVKHMKETKPPAAESVQGSLRALSTSIQSLVKRHKIIVEQQEHITKQAQQIRERQREFLELLAERNT